MMSSQALFESDECVKIWRYKVRIVGKMWQLCLSKTSDGLSGAHLCGALHYHRVTLHTFCQMNSTNTSLQTALYFNAAVAVHCCSHTQVAQKHLSNPIRKPIKNFGRTLCCIHTIVLIPHDQFTCLVLQKKKPEKHNYTNDVAWQNSVCAWACRDRKLF
jgi:hypothetical protein